MKNNKIIHLSFAVAMGLGLAACSEKTSEEYLAQGNSSLEQQKVADAIVQFKNAVRVDPKNPAARLSLGLAYLSEGIYVSADKELEQAIKLGITDEQAVLNLAVARSRLGDLDGIKLLLDNHSSLSDQNYQGILFYAGVTALNENELAKGQDFLNQAKGINSSSRFGMLAGSYALYAKGNIEQSSMIVKELLSKNNRDKEALILNGHLLSANGNYKEASDSFAKYVELVPKDYAIMYFEIGALLNDEQFDQAEQKVDLLLRLFKESPLASQYKAQLEYHKGNYRDAINYADKAVKSGLGFTVARMVAGASAFYENEFEQAYDYLRPLEDSIPSSHAIHKLLAMVKIKLGYNQAASESLGVLSDFTDADIRFLQESAGAMIKAKDFLTAQKLIEEAQKLAPNDAAFVAQRGKLLLAQNDLSGIESLERALLMDPSLENVEKSLAIQYLRFDNDKKAMAIAEKWMSNSEQRVSGLLLQGLIYAKAGQLDSAANAYEQAIQHEPSNVDALYNLGLLKEENKKYAEANELFRQVLAIEPTHAGAITYLSKTASSLGAEGELLPYLESLWQKNQGNLNVALGLAQNYRNKDQSLRAIEVLESFDGSTQKVSPAYWLILGDTYAETEQFEKAQVTYQKGLESHPDFLGLKMRKIGVLEINREFEQALSEVIEAKKLYPGNLRFEILEAYLEFRNQNMTRAQELLGALKAKQVEHPLLSIVDAQLALIDNNYDQAVVKFKKAYDKRANSMNAVNYARALKFTGQHDAAIQVLENYVANNNDAKIRVLLSELYGNDNLPKKIEHLELANQGSPGNPLILNNLAWSHHLNNNSKDAMAFIEQAYAVNNEEPAIMETYGVIAHQSGDVEKAIETLTKAMKAGGKDLDARLLLAKLQIESGEKRAAERVLESIDTNDQDILREKLALSKLID